MDSVNPFFSVSMLHFNAWYIICWGYTLSVFTLAFASDKHTNKSTIDDDYNGPGTIARLQTHIHREITSTDIQATSAGLRILIRELGEYSHPSHFEFERFDSSARLLSSHLSDLKGLVYVGYLVGSHYDEDLLDLLTFAEHMFETMLDAVMTIKYCEFHDNDAYSGIEFMATMSVRLLTFYKPNGQPDGDRPHFAHELSYLEAMYEMWVTMFMNQRAVSFSIQRTFDKYKTLVKNSLTALRTHEMLNNKKSVRL